MFFIKGNKRLCRIYVVPLMQHFAVNDHNHCVLCQGQCGNCAESAARAEKLATMVKEREVTIKELKSLCARLSLIHISEPTRQS